MYPGPRTPPSYHGEVNDDVTRREAVVGVLRRGDRFLVIKRGPRAILSGYWAPPSGRVEEGETPEETLVREIQEELGISASPIAEVWECPTDDGDFILHWWTAEAGPGDLLLNPDEVADARWVTTEEFLELDPTFAGDRDFFIRVLPNLDLADNHHHKKATEEAT